MNTTTKHHNVLAFNTAINNGYNPRDYSYQATDIPTGEYHVTLDFMIWANKVPGVDLFCTLTQTGQRIRITVFRDQEEEYRLQNVYVPDLPIGSTLALQVELNGRNKPTLHRITILKEPGIV